MKRNDWLTRVFDGVVTGNKRPRRRTHASFQAAVAIVELLEQRQLLSAGIIALGGETQVNTYTTNLQSSPTIAADANGDYVAVWQSEAQDGSEFGIYAQRYFADGTRAGGEFRVNTHTIGQQVFPAVAMDANGDFVVTWIDGGANYNIYAQRFNASGAAQGSEFRVSSSTTGHASTPKVAMDAAGDFTITWVGLDQAWSSPDIFARRFDAAGVAIGNDFLVNSITALDQNLPSIAMDSAGDFVITWLSYPHGSQPVTLYAQSFTANGAMRGSQIQIAQDATVGEDSVAMDQQGDFVVTWIQRVDVWYQGVVARRYNADGTALGAVFQVSPSSSNARGIPNIASDQNGNFVITWQVYSTLTSAPPLEARGYNAAGVALGPAFKVNTSTHDAVNTPVIAMSAAGDFTIAWDGQDGYGFGILSQRYQFISGPKVQTVRNGTGEEVVNSGADLHGAISSLSFDFSDVMNDDVGGLHSVTSRANWKLYRYGVDVSSLILGITYGFNSTTYRNTATVTFTQPLTDGGFQIVARDAIVNSQGRALDGNSDGISGIDFARNFYVSNPNTAPYLYNIETTPAFGSDIKPNQVTSSLMAFDHDNQTWTGATVWISGNYQQGDQLNFTNFGAPIGGTWNAATGTMTLTGIATVSQYRDALRSFRFSSPLTPVNPAIVRTISFQVNDGTSLSNVVSRNVILDRLQVNGVNGTAQTFTQGGSPVFIAPNLSITDSSGLNMESATITFTSWQAGDRLTFTNQFGLQHALIEDLKAHTATLTFTGHSSIANYQATLRSIAFSNVAGKPSTAPRFAEITVDNGPSRSRAVGMKIDVIAVN